MDEEKKPKQLIPGEALKDLFQPSPHPPGTVVSPPPPHPKKRRRKGPERFRLA